ncbi:unnamed protein product [Medioppia subpectinata]|uniref:HEAT repeat-containing protein 1 n=1 Tax=Medioppia subpectinata TaxID=1979941 RepID=A0A7R9KD79_9ACAR|nr:unnamed protein product [Medioppia subpectinata]CAG2100463.1 unnamed protein product [Medioppia subpectinata]
MATSLSTQLSRLRVPQTSAHKERRGMVSFLYDFLEAKSIDNDMHYAIAVSGLEALIRLDTSIERFGETLFNESSKTLDRSVQSREANQDLDTEVEAFLFTVVSKYFLLNSTHKTIEWLIYRYGVNQYNADALIASVLPYHETRLFTRLLQTCSHVKVESSKWFWLKEQKETQKIALILISNVAHLFNKEILDNVITIFTFIGTNLVHCDDQYSIQVVSDTMDAIIPILLNDKKDTKNVVINVFIDSLPDIPAHRRLNLFGKLLKILGEREHLALIFMRVIEKIYNKSKSEKEPFLNLIVALSAQIDINIQIDSLNQIMDVFTNEFTEGERVLSITDENMSDIDRRLIAQRRNEVNQTVMSLIQKIISLVKGMDSKISINFKASCILCLTQLMIYLGNNAIPVIPSYIPIILDNFEVRVELGEIDKLEKSCNETFCAFIPKMTEVTFRPLFYKLHDWAIREKNGELYYRMISFYKFLQSLADRLKSLFCVFIAPSIINNCSQMLSLFHSNNESDLTLDPKSCHLLITSILSTLSKCFLHDINATLLNKERMQTLAKPIINQLSNTLGTDEDYGERVESLCLCTQYMIESNRDELIIKDLNYQILLKTRETSSDIRLGALRVLHRLILVSGEDYLPIIPETIPFISELSEDDSIAIETLIKTVVTDLEQILGEPITKYL